MAGLGNPGKRYAATRHNTGAMAAELLAERWGLGRSKEKFRGRLYEGRAGPGGPRTFVLLPGTCMNESGDSVGPARGSLKVPLDRLLVIYDEIDLPFGEIQAKLGGGMAGHNGLRSVKRGLGSADFWRLRVGVGRPQSTDPEIVSAHVLSRFSEPDADVEALLSSAADEAERLVERIGSSPYPSRP
ncbi:MAG: aminoacyl-tRNA hydrolase [Solirubrobacterales bacterium]